MNKNNIKNNKNNKTIYVSSRSHGQKLPTTKTLRIYCHVCNTENRSIVSIEYLNGKFKFEGKSPCKRVYREQE